MKSTLVFVALFAAAHGLGDWVGGLSARFGVSLFIGSDVFINIPRSVREAKNKRWVETARPANSVLPSLAMFCPSQNDVVLCAFFDDTTYVAGLQIALPKDSHTDAVYDWTIQGYTSWTAPANSHGEVKEYWVTQQFFVSEETLQKPLEDRLAAYNSRKTLQEGAVWVTGFNGELMKISADASEIADTEKSHFTKQSCIILMGRHYYYNMTADLECSDDTMLPWFPLVHSGELIGLGFLSFGKLPDNSLVKDYFERPTAAEVKMIVPDGPQCLYDLAENPGVTTMHVYYINTPWLITCLGQ